MSNKQSWIAIFAVGALALVAVGVISRWTKDDGIAPVELVEEKATSEDRKLPPTRPLSEALGLSDDEMVVVGGIKRPKHDVDFQQDRPSEKEIVNPLPSAGLSPLVDWNANEQVKGLVSEIAVKRPNPQASSAYFGAEKFDRKTYLKDPEAYNNKIRPGRVFQSAQPAAGVKPIEAGGPTYKAVVQGEKVNLRVKAEPGMPVTFHTNQLGEFENRLKTITVSANDDGIAEAAYLAGSGSMGLINILAASPVHSEDVQFLVDVSIPE